MQDGLYQRQEFCDIVNSWFGLSIYCEISETVNNIDVNGDMLVDGSSQEPMQPTVATESEEENE